MAVWEAHLERAADGWKRGLTRSQDDYRRGLAEFLGVPENEVSAHASHGWDERIEGMGPAEFKRAIEGAWSDWLVDLYEGVTDRPAPERVRQAAEDVERGVHDRASSAASGEELLSATREAIRQRARQSQRESTGQQQAD